MAKIIYRISVITLILITYSFVSCDNSANGVVTITGIPDKYNFNKY